MALMRRIDFATSFMTPQFYLMELARELQRAPRRGQPVDEPEGTRFVALSDTLAQEIAQHLTTIAETLSEKAERERVS